MKLYQKLNLIQEAVRGLGKDKDGHGYKYVTGSKVLDHIKPIMIENGVLLKQEIISIENQRMDYTLASGKNKSEILSKVMMKFTWVDTETGEKDENLFGANGQNDWDKGVGSALTYGERYFLLKFFHINTDEDDIDNPERKPEEKEQLQQAGRDNAEERLKACTTLEQLASVYTSLSSSEKNKHLALKDELKGKLTPKAA